MMLMKYLKKEISMKKRFHAMLLILATLLCCLFALTACGGSNSTEGQYTKNATNETQQYIQLQENNTWKDETGLTGTYTLEGENITLFVGDVEYAQGTLKNNSALTLTIDGEQVSFTQPQKGGSSWPLYAIFIVLAVLLVAWFVFSGRKNKSGAREYTESIEAIKPGNKVTSRGGICGVVVEVCDDNTVVIETGTEASGKSRFKLMKECIYETDAKGPTQLAREEAELRRKQEKEAKLAAKNGTTPPADGGTAEPESAPEEPFTETPEEDGKE